MRSIWTAALLVTLVAGCEKKKNETGGSAASGAKPTGDMPPEPVAKDTTKKPPENGNGASANVMPASDEVRPPTAGDLDPYLKDIPGSGQLHAAIETNMGTFHCDLYPDKVPMTIANFVGLATGKKAWQDPQSGAIQKGRPLYDGITFHRVIDGFMIQGGDPLGIGAGGPGYNFDDEVNNGLTMKPGTLAMANAGPGTNGSQFFITEGAPDWLNNKHTIFGQCKEVELVKKIENVPKGAGDKPIQPVTITHITFSKG